MSRMNRAGFVELHRKDGTPLAVAVAHVAFIRPCRCECDCQDTVIGVGENQWIVSDAYDDVITQIAESRP